MRKEIESVLLGMLLCGLLCGCEQCVRSAEQDDVMAIRKCQEEFPAAHSYKDGARLAEFYTDDALLIPPDEPIVRGKQAIAEWYEHQLRKDQLIENPKVTLEEVEVCGNLAFNRGNFILKFKGETADKPITLNLRFITIWRKQPNGSWKFYRDIWNTNAPPASMQ
ncbi:MAG: YybH family protein [Planctomycetota bacterium]|jgi:ketosteroid isomerase-like protein